MSVDSTLTAARYGKDKVRVFRVVREGKWHHIVEYNVTALLEGDIATSYTEADNSVVVATDSIKNITYYIAKISPYILNAEKFAIHLGTFFVSKYTHIHKAFITVEQLRWSRISVPGEQLAAEDHSHAFFRDGDDKRVVNVEIDATASKSTLTAHVSSGISDLLVLKSTGSAFTSFVRDEYTTLVEVDDRILSTSVDLTYKFAPLQIEPPKDEKKLDFVVPVKKGQEGYEGSVWDEEVPSRARKATLETFAVDESASVQATLYKMAQRVIAENASIKDVTYKLPNKHYIPVDMKYLGVDNTTPLSVIFIYSSLVPFFVLSFSFILLLGVWSIVAFKRRWRSLVLGPVVVQFVFSVEVLLSSSSPRKLPTFTNHLLQSLFILQPRLFITTLLNARLLVLYSLRSCISAADPLVAIRSSFRQSMAAVIH
ncbi:hypothetical protein BDQ12DRAFT_763714 [Crucibulum laeve]|uniref:factor independent urate hydroxylase n=1 Tax=Crucibulum laeve TaxID=68775 RepID=A0A5C3LM83_9AGAR|nr:hypothetical protein BDQ12DRAFT_763714 [Crucibulum laeve]